MAGAEGVTDTPAETYNPPQEQTRPVRKQWVEPV